MSFLYCLLSFSVVRNEYYIYICRKQEEEESCSRPRAALVASAKENLVVATRTHQAVSRKASH